MKNDSYEAMGNNVGLVLSAFGPLVGIHCAVLDLWKVYTGRRFIKLISTLYKQCNVEENQKLNLHLNRFKLQL